MQIPNNNNSIGSMKTFPFAPSFQAFRDNQPYLGGTIRILKNISAFTNTIITHNLKATPKALLVLNSDVFTPKWMRAGVWNTLNITVQIDTNISGSNSITVLIF